MQVIFWIMFVVICLVAVFYWIMFKKACKKIDKLEAPQRKRLKNRLLINQITDIVEDYRKDMTHRNACESMRKISDLIIESNKKDISTDQSN